MLATGELIQFCIIILHHGKSQNIMEKSGKKHGILLAGVFMSPEGAPGEQVWDLLWLQLASYLEGEPLMWMMHLHINQKFNYDDDDNNIT